MAMCRHRATRPDEINRVADPLAKTGICQERISKSTTLLAITSRHGCAFILRESKRKQAATKEALKQLLQRMKIDAIRNRFV